MNLQHLNRFSYGHLPALENTKALCEDVVKNKIKGAFIECGIANGAHLAVMNGVDPTRETIGFDSFEGIPMAGPNDNQQPGIGAITHDNNAPLDERLISSGITVHSLAAVQEQLKSFGTTAKLIKGWFQHTVPNYKVKKIAVLRLDGDLYESTLVCLEEFWPKISKGGWLIIDDYILKGCRKACHDYLGDVTFEVVEGCNNSVVYLQKK